MTTLRRVCVFCGSSAGARASYAGAARALAAELVRAGAELVWGGGNVGLMGVVADAVLERGGRAVGVIPEALVARELAHRGAQDLRVVRTMHERKALMADLSDAFVALPGGLGTLDELFEILTWAQLGLHAKPVGLLDVDGYYGPLLAFVDRAQEEGFVRAKHAQLLLVETDPARLVQRLRAARDGAAEAGRDLR